MDKIEYKEAGMYHVDIDPSEGVVTLGGVQYIINNKREAYVFKFAYMMGREHKKSQITKALGL